MSLKKFGVVLQIHCVIKAHDIDEVHGIANELALDDRGIANRLEQESITILDVEEIE